MGAFDRFLEPPRLRTTSDDEDRRATWLELFFDLVFVAAIAELSYVLLADVTVGGFARYLGYFVPIWWAWMGFTFYANRFDTDDLPYRLLTLAGMLGIAALAVNVRHVLEGARAENAFVLSYVAIRLVLLVLYARARRHVERPASLHSSASPFSSGSRPSSSRRRGATSSGASLSGSSSLRRCARGGSSATRPFTRGTFRSDSAC